MSDTSPSNQPGGIPREQRDPRTPTIHERFARSIVHRALRFLDEGEICVREGNDVRTWGRRTAARPERVEVEVLSPAFYPAIAFRGTVGSGEAWTAGDWTCDDLTSLIRIILHNQGMRASLESGAVRVAMSLRRLVHALRRNHRTGSRRNIAAHYDLGNDFFAEFLDPTLTYSAGIFETPTATMEQASIAKYESLCKAIDLREADHLLEIGTGWGGFAIHAARTRGCRVTTTTISRAQFEEASARVEAAGLSDRVEVLCQDYRDIEGRYDKLVSIEMIEAVGHQYFQTFFDTCSARLADHGRMALQCILIQDEHYERATRTVDFIKRYIFPGGCLPSLGVIADCVSRGTDLVISGGEDITSHYAETLRRWRAQLEDRAAAIQSLGYPPELLRLWEFYFCYCEAGFEERHTGTVQLTFEKPAAG